MEINLNDITIYTSTNRAIIYLFKFNNENTRKWCELCSSSTRKTSAVFIVNFLVFLLLTVNIFQTFF